MPAARLDQALMMKLVRRTRKPLKYVREQVSKKAAKQGISSEAALILWARDLGIGTARFQRRLDPHMQEEVRAGLPSLFSGTPRNGPGTGKTRAGTQRGRRPPQSRGSTRVAGLRAVIDYLLSDEELRRRCRDLLTARGSFDRAVREATTVLEHRLKHLAQIKGKINPEALVARVLHPEKAVLILSEHEDEQLGFFNMVKGLMAAFRNPTHHSLNDRMTREDALRVCGFVDVTLTLLNRARVNPPSIP